MPDGAVIDTDVLMKASAYRMADDLVAMLAPLGEPGALGLTHLIAAKQLAKIKKRLVDLDGALAELERLLHALARIEPSDQEIELAAEFEEAALAGALPLDRGEAQLIAVLITRGLPLLLTGDKRAIGCLEEVLATVGRSGACTERVACLEQLLTFLVTHYGTAAIRSRICAEPEMDTALRLCFGCGRAVFDEDSVGEALDSFVRHTREAARGVLFAGDPSAFA